MAHTTGNHTAHTDRMHRHRREVHAAAAQATADAVATVAEHYSRVEPSPPPTGQLKPKNGAPDE